MNVLLLSLLLLSAPPQVEEISFNVSSVKRSELPDDFPFQVLYEGFAVLKLRMENRSSEAWTFRPEEVEVFEPKGKKLDRAVPTDMAPKLMKYYRGAQRGIYGEGYSGGRPTTQEWEQVPTVEPGKSSGTVSIGVGSSLRAVLEHYQVREVNLAPGETAEGFFYLKSNKSGGKLAGSSLRLQNQVSIEIP
jgi:hypothetical protein